MRILQIIPDVHLGSGVEAVAFHLEQEWRQRGIPVARFTLTDAGGGWLPEPGDGVAGRLALMARVVWFSTVGTVAARRLLARLPEDCVSVCHNDVLAGDLYVNHGIVAEAMRARGRVAWRMIRNPTHLFTWARDALRYGTRTHRYVVDLTAGEEAALARTFPRLRPPIVTIGNGVDTTRYRPDPLDRMAARADLGLDATTPVALFVGHEYARKGLPLVLDALIRLPDVVLLVVGGTADLISRARRDADRRGVGARVRFVGATPDPRPYFHASDVFVFPSAYESYGLVVLEALACGLPVVATAVGCVPDVVTPGHNGVIVAPSAEAIAAAVTEVLAGDRPVWARAARRSAEAHSWSAVAESYLTLINRVIEERASTPPGAGRR